MVPVRCFCPMTPSKTWMAVDKHRIHDVRVRAVGRLPHPPGCIDAARSRPRGHRTPPPPTPSGSTGCGLSAARMSGRAPSRPCWRQFGSARGRARRAARPGEARRRARQRGSAARTTPSRAHGGKNLGVSLLAPGETGYPSRLAMHRRCPALARRARRAGRADAADDRHRRLAQCLGGRNQARRPARARTRRRRLRQSSRGWRAASMQPAHRAAVASGTIAVLAGGHDRIYPPENVELAAAILAQGAAISEMPPGHEPRAHDFPRRNRLISGAALGVVVIEAAQRSGSLITARLANEQGREVFAVPGSPLDPRAAGTNDLIKQGATLVTEVDDVIAVVTPIMEQPLDRCRRRSPTAIPVAGEPDNRRAQPHRRAARADAGQRSTIWCGSPIVRSGGADRPARTGGGGPAPTARRRVGVADQAIRTRRPGRRAEPRQAKSGGRFRKQCN